MITMLSFLKLFPRGGLKALSSRALVGFVVLFGLVALSGCNYPGYAQPQSPQILPPTGTQVRLPDTWTIEPFTGTPTSTATPRATTTPTTTNTPPAVSTETPGTAAPPGPSPTIDYMAKPYPDCRYIATKAGLRLQQAPFVDPYRSLPTMEPGKTYQSVVDKPTYTLLLDGDEPAGWVDYRSVGLQREGSECLTRRTDQDIIEFPSLCLFSPKSEINGYRDRDLSQVSQALNPAREYILLLKYLDVFFSAYGHAGPSFYVANAEVSISGDCQTIPSAGVTNRKTGLYAQPDLNSPVLTSLPVGHLIYVQPNRSSGSPPPEGTSSGEWVQVRVSGSTGGWDGWCWSEFFDLQ